MSQGAGARDAAGVEATEPVEVEQRTYVVGQAFTLAALRGRLRALGSVVEEPASVVLATTFDTDDLALSRAGIVLQRRLDPGESGWRLESPPRDGREAAAVEVSLRASAGAAGQVPRDIEAALAAHAGRVDVVPVVHVRTERRSLSVVGPSGTPVAEVHEDRVVAVGRGERALGAWWELAARVPRDDSTVADAVERHIVDAGARRSRWPAEIAHVLPGTDLRGGDRRGWDPILGRVGTQVAALLHCEVGARLGDAEAVHDMRVATRRLGSCLKTFAPGFDGGLRRDARTGLAAVAERLGAVRDATVVARLASEVDRLDDELVAPGARALLAARAEERARDAHRALLSWLDDRTYGDLLEILVAAVTRPARPSDVPSSAWYRRRLRRIVRRSEALVRAAERAAGADREAALHTARKAVKGVRYAAETVAPLLGRKADRAAGAFQHLQTVLGDHHDAVLASAFLRAEATRIVAPAPSEPLPGATSPARISSQVGHDAGGIGFTFGVLAAAETARAEVATARFVGAWPKARALARNLAGLR